MPDDRGPECTNECTQLAVLGSKMAEVERKLEIILPRLSEARANLAQFANYRAWRGNVTGSLGKLESFIERQDQQAIDLAKHLQERKDDDDKRRTNFRWSAGLLFVVVLGLLSFLGTKAWDQITILNRLENDWLRYQPPVESFPKAPMTDKAPHHSFWHPSTPITMEKPQNAAGSPTHF